jgi:hypothetical protein
MRDRDYNHGGTGRRPEASPLQLIALLRLRLKELRACVGRIEGIEQRLHDLRVRVPVRLPQLPDWKEVSNAASGLLAADGGIRDPRRRTGNGGRRRTGRRERELSDV